MRDDVNFFRSRELTVDPYPFFDDLRERCPVLREPHRGVYMVTGYDEAISVYRDPATFSSCNAVSGPFVKFSVPVEGDDISRVIDAHRDELPFSDQLPSFDPPKHTAHRGLLMRLITPKRLKENEDFMWRLADRQIDEILDNGKCEFIGDFAQPFTLLVIADLLGVPEADHTLLRERLASHSMGVGSSEPMEHKPLEFLYGQFTTYIEERRRAPRTDVMGSIATATFPDGTLPDVHDVALIAANLFTAGQETTARMLGFALQVLGDRPDVQPNSATTAASSPRSSKRCFASKARSRASSAWRGTRPTSTASPSVRATPSWCCPVLPIAMPASSSARKSSASTVRTVANISRSGTASTPAPARHSRAPRAGSASNASSIACSTSSSRTSITARRATATSTTCRPTSCARSNGSTSSSLPSRGEHGHRGNERRPVPPGARAPRR